MISGKTTRRFTEKLSLFHRHAHKFSQPSHSSKFKKTKFEFRMIYLQVNGALAGMPFSPQSALDLQRSEVGNFSKFKKLTPAY
jgi:hypothetical protein